MALSGRKIKRKGIDEVAKMSHAKIEWLVSKWGIGPELCQYKNIVMKRKRGSIEIICKESSNTSDLLINRCEHVHENKEKKCHYYVICIRVVSLWINTLKSRANFSNANVSLTTRVLDTNALNWIAVRTAVQDSQILVLEVMKDKINFFVVVVGCFFSCSRDSWCILIPRLLSLVRDIKIAFCCAYQLDVRLDL